MSLYCSCNRLRKVLMGNMVIIILRIKFVSQNPCYKNACYSLDPSCKHYLEKLLVDSKDNFHMKETVGLNTIFMEGIYFTCGGEYSLKILLFKG